MGLGRKDTFDLSLAAPENSRRDRCSAESESFILFHKVIFIIKYHEYPRQSNLSDS